MSFFDMYWATRIALLFIVSAWGIRRPSRKVKTKHSSVRVDACLGGAIETLNMKYSLRIQIGSGNS